MRLETLAGCVGNRHIRRQPAVERPSFGEAADSFPGPSVKLIHQMEQQRAVRGADRQITRLVKDDEIGLGESAGDLACLAPGLSCWTAMAGSILKKNPNPVAGFTRKPS